MSFPNEQFLKVFFFHKENSGWISPKVFSKCMKLIYKINIFQISFFDNVGIYKTIKIPLQKSKKFTHMKKPYYPELNIPFSKLCSSKTLSLVYKCVHGHTVIDRFLVFPCQAKCCYPLYKASYLYKQSSLPRGAASASFQSRKIICNSKQGILCV